MLKITSLEDIAALTESSEVECKLAAGKDGKGRLPKDFWKTYSSFANSYGGDVFLGLEEKGKAFHLNGIQKPQPLLDEFWNHLNNPEKVSANVINRENLKEIIIDGKMVIHIHIPRAQRKIKPVFINGNPLTGTYKRINSGDCRCDGITVKRMLAEQVEESRDNEILLNYDLNDIDLITFREYRRIHTNLNPDHPWVSLESVDFMRNIGGWRVDRESSTSGLTRAGLLMFGKLPSIQEAFPHYFLDYQERSEVKTENRWIDRLTADGSWSGNLFDFYRKIIQRLFSNLKVPFTLEGDQRRDDTPIHQALREALVNTLVHADFTDRASILIVKRPDMFGFRNPGLMRIPLEIAIQGGESDCRNRIVHQMFRYVALGEQAGSGLPKILQGWNSQHWNPPALYEKEIPSEQTLLELHMMNMLPEGAIEQLKNRFGKKFELLTELERIILATVITEGVVRHSRLAEITTQHTHDLTLAFQKLVKQGFLETHGQGRGTTYNLVGTTMLTPDSVFDLLPSREIRETTQKSDQQTSSEHLVSSSEHLDVSSEHLDASSEHLDASSEHLVSSSEHLDVSSEHLDASSEHLVSSSEHLDASSEHLEVERDTKGRLIVKELDKPLIDNLGLIDEGFRRNLEIIACEARNKKRLEKQKMKQIILQLCCDQFLMLTVLAQLLNRNADALRQQYLAPMVKGHEMTLAFPATPTHERQAYKTSQ